MNKTIVLDDLALDLIREALSYMKEQYREAIKDDPNNPEWVEQNEVEMEEYDRVLQLILK